MSIFIIKFRNTDFGGNLQYLAFIILLAFSITSFISGNNSMGTISLIVALIIMVIGIYRIYSKNKNYYRINNDVTKTNEFYEKGVYNINKFIDEDKLFGSQKNIFVVVGSSMTSYYDDENNQIYVGKSDNINFLQFSKALITTFNQAVDKIEQLSADSDENALEDFDDFDINQLFDEEDFDDDDLDLDKLFNLEDEDKNDDLYLDDLDFESMSVTQLKEFCKENNIKGYSKLNKRELIQLIENYNFED